MTRPQLTPPAGVLVAIDVAKARNEVLIEVPGSGRRRRLSVLNTRAEHDRLIALLSNLGQPVTCGFEATGNYHRPIAWRLLQAGFAVRLISSVGRINATRLRTGQLEDEDWSRVTSAIRLLREARIFIDDEPALSPEKLRAKARRVKKEHGLGLIVIDYLQLMQVPGNSENRATEISEISRSLKGLAKELNVPVIALSQLNRSLETRTDKRPVMADLRESGAIEQDADMIVFIYRDDYYNKENSPDKGLAEVIIGKQRSGPTGSFKLKFFGEYTRFDNLAHDSVGSFE